MTADNIEHVISYWVIFQAFHSPSLAGFAVISHWVPFLLFSVYAGALADRYDCRRLIQISQGLFMLASFAWGVLFLSSVLRMWHAVVILLLHGAAGVISAPAVQLNIAFTSMAQTLVQLLAPPALRGRIVGLFNTAILGLRAGSGLTVGVLGAVIGVQWSLALSAGAVLVMAVTLLAYEGHRARGGHAIHQHVRTTAAAPATRAHSMAGANGRGRTRETSRPTTAPTSKPKT